MGREIILFAPHHLASCSFGNFQSRYLGQHFLFAPRAEVGGAGVADNSRSVGTRLFNTLGIFQWIDLALDEKSQKETVQHQFAARRGWDVKSEPLDVALWIPRGTREPANH